MLATPSSTCSSHTPQRERNSCVGTPGGKSSKSKHQTRQLTVKVEIDDPVHTISLASKQVVVPVPTFQV